MPDARRYDPEEELPEPAPVRRLRLMVSALIFVLIAGVVTVAATLVIRLGALEPRAAPPIAAERLVLPEGEMIVAMGQGGGRVLIATRDAAGVERLRAFDAGSGAQSSVTLIERE